MSILSRIGKSAATLVAVAALAAAGAPIASAMPAQPSSGAGQVDKLDPALDGSATLTVHKYAVSPGHGNEATGLPLRPEDEPKDPLAGAAFTLYRVDLSAGNTSTNAGWQAIADLQSAVGVNPSMTALEDAAGVEGVTEVRSETTDASGQAFFDSLSFGLYYVVESSAPEGYFPIAPFLVAVPMTNPEDLGQWIYDVHVYPKDRPGPQKEVLDGESAGPGDSVTWRISTSVPWGEVGGLTIRDTLAQQLLYKDVFQVALVNADSGELVQVFKEGIDYTVQVSHTSAGLELVEIVFLSEGLEYLDTVEDPSFRVIVDLETECLEAGIWENQAYVCDTTPDSAGGSGRAGGVDEICLSTNTVVTRWGQLTVIKTDSADIAMTLAGAEFRLYYNHVNDFNTAVPADVVGTTGAGGETVFAPLRFSDFAFENALNADDPAYWYYWLVETKAPSGYQLPTTPIPFELTVSGADAKGNLTLSVKNVAQPDEPGPETPGPGGSVPGGLAVTGAAVALFVVLAGVALLSGALARRRKDDEANA